MMNLKYIIGVILIIAVPFYMGYTNMKISLELTEKYGEVWLSYLPYLTFLLIFLLGGLVKWLIK